MKKTLFCPKQKFAGYLNENGFTLIEAMFALSIFMTVVFFITPILQVILPNLNRSQRLQGMEWEVFCSQIKREIRSSSSAEIAGNRLYLTKDADTVVYEKYGSNIRRRVNGSGHEIILQNTSDITFTLIKNAVKVSVKDLRGDNYTVTAFTLMNWDYVP